MYFLGQSNQLLLKCVTVTVAWNLSQFLGISTLSKSGLLLKKCGINLWRLSAEILPLLSDRIPISPNYKCKFLVPLGT